MIEIKKVESIKQLSEIVDFEKTNIGAPEEWLTGYNTNLINRQDLFGFWQNERLVAIGEWHTYDKYQTDFVDQGFVVDKNERGKGIGKKVINYLVAPREAKGLKPTCSTDKTNMGAQKAISNAGFFAGNRIVQFDIFLFRYKIP